MLAQSRGLRGRPTAGASALLLAAPAATWLLAGRGGRKDATKAGFVAKAKAIRGSPEQQLKAIFSVRAAGGFEAKLEEEAKTGERSVAVLRKSLLPPQETRRAASEEESKARQGAIALARSYGLTDCLTS